MTTKRFSTACAILAAVLLLAAPAFAAPGDFLAAFGQGVLNNPLGQSLAANGKLYVCDYGNGDAKVFDATGAFLSSFDALNPAREYPQYSLFLNPHSLAVHGSRVYVANSGLDRIEVFDLAGAPLFQITAPVDYPWAPGGLATDAAGNLYVTDVGSFTAFVLDPDGKFLRPLDPAAGIGYSDAIAVGRDGAVYVGSDSTNTVLVFAADGSFLRSVAGGFDMPSGVAVDRDGRLYVSDFMNHRIQVLDSAGAPLAVFANGITDDGSAMMPTGLALDEAAGRLYVADMWNSRIQVFEAFPVSACGLAWKGFLPPVSLSKPFQAGSTIPVKFQLADCEGAPVDGSRATLTLRKGAVEVVARAKGVKASKRVKAGVDNVFANDGSGQYHFNLDTKGLAAGKWTLVVTLADATEHTKGITLK